MIYHILFFFLCGSLLILAFINYKRAPVSRGNKIVLISLKTLSVLLLLTAFFEPVITLERLSSANNNIPVLIDVSESMKLFNKDSVIISQIKKLQWYEKNSGLNFSYYLFGDSLRSIPAEWHYDFSDQKSFLPVAFKNKELRESSDLLLISDGNWTNPSVPFHIFSEKNIFFSKLTQFNSKPYININASIQDTSSVMDVKIEGIVSQKNLVTIKAASEKHLTQKDVKVDSGYFSTTVKLDLPGKTPGRHLYSVEVFSPEDSLYAQSFIIQNVLPSKFLYSLFSKKPSLDIRFLTSALALHPEFTRIDIPANKKLDCIFLFNDTSKISKKLTNLKNTGLLIFAGTSPNSTVTKSGSTAKYILPQSDYSNPLKTLDLKNLPFLYTISMSSLKDNNLLPLLLFKEDNNQPQPLIYLSSYSGKTSLTIGATGFWKWDFLPLSLTKSESEAFFFSRLIISTIKTTLLSQLYQNYLIYPSNKTVENLPIDFTMNFPSKFQIATKAQLTMSLFKDTTKIIDTTFQKVITGTESQSFSLDAKLKPGIYRYKSTARTENGKNIYTYTDSLHIMNSNNEYITNGQNEMLLNQIGQSINLKDTTATVNSLRRDKAPPKMQKEQFHILRSWPLLLLFFMCIGLEWGIRKKTGLD